MSYGLAQARYTQDATETVSPARLLTMLYDRLVSDLATAEQAMIAGDVRTTGDKVAHAQEIILELHSTLDLSIWPQGEPLAHLYLWLVSELMQARLRKDARRLADCRAVVEPLRDAWREAAVLAARAEAAQVSTQGGAA